MRHADRLHPGSSYFAGRSTVVPCSNQMSGVRACVLCHFSCVQLCDPTDCSLPGSSAHGILQAGILERGLPCPSPWELPDPGIEPTSPVSSAFSRFLTPEPPGKPKQVTWDFRSAVVFSFHEYTYNFCILFYSVINFLPTSFLIRERAVFVPEKKSRVAPKATVITNSQVTSAGKPLSSN